MREFAPQHEFRRYIQSPPTTQMLPSFVAVDMSAFDKVHIIPAGPGGEDTSTFVVAGVRCRTKHIIRKAMTMDLTAPLGSRPNVGAGPWLQGGIGHLGRLHGLTCDSILGRR
jgi:hypothetical protein